MTSVLAIDDDPIVLKGCRVLEDPGVQIVLEARDLVSGYRLYCRRHRDVVVIDLKMGAQNLGGLSLIRWIRLRDSRTRILVQSMHDNPAIVTSALEAGASGYLLKDCASEELARAVEQARAGKPYPVTGSPYRSLCGKAIHNPMCWRTLTQRKIQTLALLSRVRSNALTAVELGVRRRTVLDMSSQLRLKLAIRSLREVLSGPL